MKKTAGFVAIAFVSALADPCSAGQASADDCAAPGSALETAQCATERFRKFDALLTSIVNEMTQEPRFRARARQLRVAEDLWLNYRGAQCAFEASSDTSDGSIPMIKEAQCAARLTDLHTQQLARAMRCDEGDLGC